MARKLENTQETAANAQSAEVGTAQTSQNGPVVGRTASQIQSVTELTTAFVPPPIMLTVDKMLQVRSKENMHALLGHVASTEGMQCC